MEHLDRVIASSVIWVAFAAILIAAPNVTNDGFIVMVLAIAAAVPTAIMWDSTRTAKEGESAEEKSGKAKREHSPIARLVEVLDEDELEELRQRLIADEDGELVELDTLLRQEHR